MRAQNVDFVQARGEELPFGDDSFDAALLVTVLEYGDAPRILREAARVTRPGGAIVAAGLIDRALPQALLRRWAGPVLRLARKYRLPMRRTHSGPNLAGLLRAAGLVEVETLQLQAHIDLSDIDALADSTRQGGSLVQGVLFDLPWAARQDLLRDLVEHGRRLTRSLEPARLVVPIPLHFARGVVPAG